jgi:hypothetical protein
VDHHLVRAEMNGMDYHLRVLQPFARDPAYYVSIITSESDTPAKEGPVIHGAIKLYGTRSGRARGSTPCSRCHRSRLRI